jgi:hypothetical protein
MRDRFAATNNCVVLATVLNTVEQISEVAGSIGRSDVRHAIRSSDSTAKVNLSATPITRYRTTTSTTLNSADRHLPSFELLP